MTSQEVRDEAILDFIFTPGAERPVTQQATVTIPSFPARPAELTDERLEELRLLEQQAIQLADKNQLKAAYDLLTAAITSATSYASAYNNRAQVLRLMNKIDLALLDLNRAVDLAHDSLTLRQALTQRGMLFKLQQQDQKAFEDFERAGQLGSEFAKKEAVSVNPFAQLCSNMVTQVLQTFAP